MEAKWRKIQSVLLTCAVILVKIDINREEVCLPYYSFIYKADYSCKFIMRCRGAASLRVYSCPAHRFHARVAGEIAPRPFFAGGVPRAIRINYKARKNLRAIQNEHKAGAPVS